MSIQRLVAAATVAVAVLGFSSSASAQGRPGGCAAGSQGTTGATSTRAANLYNRQSVAAMQQSAQLQAQWRTLQAQAYQQALVRQAQAQQQAYLQAAARQQAQQQPASQSAATQQPRR